MDEELQRLNLLLQALESQLAITPVDAPHYQFNQDNLRNLRLRIESIEHDIFQNYRGVLTHAHLAVLRSLMGSNHADPLLRRAYVLAYCGCICTALFEREDFREMKPYFPGVKLPLLADAQDRIQFSNIQCRGLSLERSVSNAVLDFHADPRAKPEENIRTMLWAPILKAMFDTLKFDLGIEGLNMMAEFNTRNIPDFHELRFIDLVVAASGSEGLPFLLVEMSAHPVPEGRLHKDFRKMAMTTLVLLVEMVKRAVINCPNDDISKFRVFGLLISGSSFELCVGTVVKDEEGHITFMFHSNANHWKFSLDDTELGLTADDFICTGSSVIVGPYEQFVTTPRHEGEIEPETEFFPTQIPIIDDEEEVQLGPDFVSLDPQVNQEPRLVLWKFLIAAMNYYRDLPECLQNCVKSVPARVPGTDLRSIMLLKALRLPIASSGPSHTVSSPQQLPVSIDTDRIVNSATQAQLYNSIMCLRLPTLPKVIVFDQNTNTVTFSDVKFGIFDFNQIIEAREDLYRPELSCLAAKFFLDMLMAAFEIHKRGLVCGGFVDYYIRYDGVFWFLNKLSCLKTVEEAEEFGPVTFSDRIVASSHLQPPQILSQKDDLYTITRTFMYCFNNRFRNMIFSSSLYPLFDHFKKETYDVMNNIQNLPDASVESILLNAIPLYNYLVDGTKLDDSLKKPVMATKIMANGLLSELSMRRGSISMESIQSTTTESTENK